jgi:hypothetical protein
MQLVAGRTAQAYNERKDRHGAFWEDRYHATAVETGEHVARCIVYIDLNMVRAGMVRHPAQWKAGGYHEIQAAPVGAVRILCVGDGAEQRLQQLNDPELQRQLVEEQAAKRAAGNAEAMPHNEPFVRSIEYGMPPCGGLGFGIDRMVMLLTGATSIRDVIALPLVRP